MEPTRAAGVAKTLMQKIDGLNLDQNEHTLMAAILAAASGRVHIVQVPSSGTYFTDEFADAFTAGPITVDDARSDSQHYTVHMIVR